MTHQVNNLQFHVGGKAVEIEPFVFHVIFFHFDDPGAGFARPDASDSRVDDDFQTTLEGEATGVLMKMAREYLGHA